MALDLVDNLVPDGVGALAHLAQSGGGLGKGPIGA